MSTHAIGFRPPDDLWKRHKAVWDACEAAAVDIPKSTLEFFNHEPPDNAGVNVEIEETPAVCKWQDDSRAGFEIDVTKLPKDVTMVRVYNAW